MSDTRVKFLRRFQQSQRVTIACADYGELAGESGTVVRLRLADDGAWVKMDVDLPAEYRAFPADDAHGRGRHLLLYPEQCVASPEVSVEPGYGVCAPEKEVVNSKVASLPAASPSESGVTGTPSGEIQKLVDDLWCFTETYGLKHSITIAARTALLDAVSRLQRELDDTAMMLAVWRQAYEPNTYGVLPKSVVDEANAEFNRLAMRRRNVECLDVYRGEPKHEV